jgi:hypothetical protein
VPQLFGTLGGGACTRSSGQPSKWHGKRLFRVDQKLPTAGLFEFLLVELRVIVFQKQNNQMTEMKQGHCNQEDQTRERKKY